MNERDRELAGLVALGVLNIEEAARVTDDATGDPRLADQLQIDHAVVARVEQVVARVTPRADLIESIVAAARASVATDPEPDAAARPSPRTTRARWFAGRRFAPAAALASIAAVALVIGLVATRGSSPTEPFARAPVVAHGGSAVAGTVELFDPDRSNGHVVVDLEAVPQPPAGHHYEVWVLAAGSTRMTAIGVFRPGGPRAHLDLRLPAVGRYAALDISLEDDGGPATHSGVSVAGASFGSA